MFAGFSNITINPAIDLLSKPKSQLIAFCYYNIVYQTCEMLLFVKVYLGICYLIPEGKWSISANQIHGTKYLSYELLA